MSKTLAIKDHEGLCWNCLETKENVRKIVIPEMGYGSGFDGAGTEVHLCEECYQKSNPKIWGLNVIKEDYCEEYEFEKEMFEFFNQMPILGQQFVLNEFERGWMSNHRLDPQDWIDYEEKTISHERCKELGLYSHQEISAYKERFPICEYPVNKIYSDGSIGCWCPFGASGDKDQKVGLNISDDCYMCKYFKERVTPLKTIKSEEWNDYKLYIQFNVNKEVLEKKFGV